MNDQYDPWEFVIHPGAGAGTESEALAELRQVQIAFGLATTKTEVDPDRRWDAIKLVSEYLGKLRLHGGTVKPCGPSEPLRCLRCGTIDAFGPVSRS